MWPVAPARAPSSSARVLRARRSGSGSTERGGGSHAVARATAWDPPPYSAAGCHTEMSDWPGTVPRMGKESVIRSRGHGPVAGAPKRRNHPEPDARMRDERRGAAAQAPAWWSLAGAASWRLSDRPAGSPPGQQRQVAAQSCTRDLDSVITGPAALMLRNRSGRRRRSFVDVLVPERRRRRERGFVRLHRTARMPNVDLLGRGGRLRASWRGRWRTPPAAFVI